MEKKILTEKDFSEGRKRAVAEMSSTEKETYYDEHPPLKITCTVTGKVKAMSKARALKLKAKFGTWEKLFTSYKSIEGRRLSK